MEGKVAVYVQGRYAKPITRDMLRAFFSGLGRSGVAPSRMKVYNIVGWHGSPFPEASRYRMACG